MKIDKKNNEAKKIKKPFEPLSLKKMFLKSSVMAVGIASLMLLVTVLIAGVWGYFKFKTFLKSAEITKQEFISEIKTGWNKQPIATNDHKNFLVLGLDTLEGRGDIPALTDTMMLASVNLKNGSISTLPLPRDLWSEAYKTKINAFYHYGLERYPDIPEKFPEEAIEELTGLEIHHTIVISLEQLEQLIDLVGGIRIDVKQGFVDTEFPRSGVDVTIERDPAVLYETISFEAGVQNMDGETALKYIRSRKSENEQGHDLARSNRQQEVISALAGKLANLRQYLSNPKIAGELFAFYRENFETQLSLSEMVSAAKALYPHKNDINFTAKSLSTTLEDGKNGVIDNPRPSPYRYQNQWVYVVTDVERFQSEVEEKLMGKN